MKSYIYKFCIVFFCLSGHGFAQQQGRSLSENLELLGQISPGEENVAKFNYNEVWGYAADGREYAIIGARNGTWFIEVTDPTEPRVIDFFKGTRSTWRDIKTHQHYAYVVHERENGTSIGEGMQIFDLSGLPGSVELVNTSFQQMPGGTAHNIFIHDGLLFIAGMSSGGPSCAVLNLNDKPTKPQAFEVIQGIYWHDVVFNAGIIFGSALEGGIKLYEWESESKPQLISTTDYPQAFTHNLWPTADNRYLVSTDERFGLPLRFWDISDLSAPEQVAEYEVGPKSVAHNVHVMGDYAYVSFYYDGLKIFDISQRTAPCEIAWYNTYADGPIVDRSIFDGAWGVYPNLPSGNILVSDMTYGLHILRFNEVKAGGLQGLVRDSQSGVPLADVKISIIEPAEYDGRILYYSDNSGNFHLSQRPGRFGLRFYKDAYEPLIITDHEFVSGQIENLDIDLKKLPTRGVRITVEDQNAVAMVGFDLKIDAVESEMELVAETDARGQVQRSLPVGTYRARINQWGAHLSNVEFQIEISQANDIQEVRLIADRVYRNNFNASKGWGPSPGDQALWKRQRARNANPPYPEVDFAGQANGIYAWCTAQRNTGSMNTQEFDCSQMPEPTLRFYRWYYPLAYTLSPNADDSLQVWLSNGTEEVLMDVYTNVVDKDWQLMEYRLDEYLSITETMRVRFRVVEADRLNRAAASVRIPVHAAIDDFVVASASYNPGTGIASDARESVNSQLFDLRPNPTQSQFSIVPAIDFSGRGNILTISDVRGRIISSESIRVASGQSLSVDLSGQVAGVYFVRLQAADGRQQSRQIVLTP